MSAPLIVEDLVRALRSKYGSATSVGQSRIIQFGQSMTCSINYSKLLGGHRFFFGLGRDVVDPAYHYPETKLGDYVLLVCGSVDNVLALPRELAFTFMSGVPSRRIDVFLESGSYILQTTGHPKLNVTKYLNAFPKPAANSTEHTNDDLVATSNDRTHVKIQWGLIQLGRAEGCRVWVPPADRCLAFQGQSFAETTLERLPNFGFDENTRRIVQNIRCPLAKSKRNPQGF